MNARTLEQAFGHVEANLDLADFDGHKPDELISIAEDALSLSFPPTYRKFLSRLGCGDFCGREFYGIINDDFVDSSIPDAIWLTLSERRESRLPDTLILIGDSGDGGYYALDCALLIEGEAPVIVWKLGERCGEQVANSFGEYFTQLVFECDS